MTNYHIVPYQTTSDFISVRHRQKITTRQREHGDIVVENNIKSIHSCFQRYKNLKNRSSNARIIVQNNMAHFLLWCDAVVVFAITSSSPNPCSIVLFTYAVPAEFMLKMVRPYICPLGKSSLRADCAQRIHLQTSRTNRPTKCKLITTLSGRFSGSRACITGGKRSANNELHKVDQRRLYYKHIPRIQLQFDRKF